MTGTVDVERLYVATAPANLRKSFEGLSNEVRAVLALDPLSGHVFLFLNRRRTQVKMLLFTRGGFTIVHKRLERGRFTFPAQVTPEAVRVEIEAHELSALGAKPGDHGTNQIGDEQQRSPARMPRYHSDTTQHQCKQRRQLFVTRPVHRRWSKYCPRHAARHERIFAAPLARRVQRQRRFARRER